MNSYRAGADVKKHRAVAQGGSWKYVLQIPHAGKPVTRVSPYDHRTLAAPGLAIGIATEDAKMGEHVDVADREGDRTLAEAGEIFDPEAQLIADGEGRLVVARPGVRLSEPILAIALEGADDVGQIVAVKIAPHGMAT